MSLRLTNPIFRSTEQVTNLKSTYIWKNFQNMTYFLKQKKINLSAKFFSENFSCSFYEENIFGICGFK